MDSLGKISGYFSYKPFLREYDLIKDFKLNLVVNHATLARHTFQHELQVAADARVFESMDAFDRMPYWRMGKYLKH